VIPCWVYLVKHGLHVKVEFYLEEAVTVTAAATDYFTVSRLSDIVFEVEFRGRSPLVGVARSLLDRWWPDR
jgi:hypothetical protein